MRVVVTGGTGDVGRAAVSRLAAEGHEVTVLGRSAGSVLFDDTQGVEYAQCDISDFDSLAPIVRGHDAIVHLAAHRSPVGVPGREVFGVNALGTFNVFEAAAEAGIGRVVAASSINAVGYFFGDRGVPIRYLPIDEDHPTLATDAYSFSKQSMEAIAAYFWERDGISSVLLRLPGVIAHSDILSGVERYANYDVRIVERLLALDAADLESELRRIQLGYDRYRRTHRSDKHAESDWWNEPDEACGLSHEEFHFMHHKVNFFTYIDELDSAQSIVKGLFADYEGSHPLFVNARRNSLGLSVSALARLYAPDAPEVRPSRNGDNTIVSVDTAREIIGFEPEWAVTGHFDGGR